MTEKLYLDDPTPGTFTATVEDRTEDRVVLDRTAFYPTGGGQPNDTGVLGANGERWRVVDVEGRDRITHRLDGRGPAVGTEVTGEIDAARRNGHRRHHTAQHLLSAVLLEVFDAETVGNQVYAERARLDAAYPRFDDDDLERIEGRLNELVDTGHPVRWTELPRGRAAAELDPERTRIGRLPDAVTDIRIVEIGPEAEPYDRTACAGTHVENTAEIGQITVTGRETQGSDAERVRFRVEPPT